MRILPQHASAEVAADISRFLLLVSTTLGAPATFIRWEADADDLAVPVLGVPADAADRARALGLSVEVA